VARNPDVALLYFGLAALNVIVLAQGVWGHLYRYVGVGD
jgi:hypothetical protein